MARETGTNPLINELLEEGHKFFFVQVMRLVRRHLEAGGNEGVPRIPWQERVRVRPRLSMAFPAADVSKVERDGDGFRVTASFLGFYGAASPLPNFYTEELLEEAANEETVLRDFLDVINRRLYDLYLQCWSKYRLIIRIVEEDSPIDRERLLCIIGLGEKGLASSIPDAFSLLGYANILTQFPRSAAGLRTMLRDVFGIQSIRIIRNVKRMVSIPPNQRVRMGISNCRLGIDTVLGSKIADRSGKFDIEVGPLTLDEYDNFLPGTANHEKLSRYVRFYLTDPLEVELKLILAAGEARPIRIGDPKARLGLNMWCFSGESIGEVSAVFPLASLQFKSAPPDPGTRIHTEERGFVDCYRQELDCLRKLAADFVEKHPALAPRVSGQAADPGVERLLEGTAFFNALLQRKLDDDIPEFIHEVMEEIEPSSIRHIPSTTIVAFTPKAQLTRPLTVSAGAEVDSIPIKQTRCRFRSCFDITVHPVKLKNAGYSEPSGKHPVISLELELNRMSLSAWQGDSLRLFLSGTYHQACDIYLLLMRYLKQIIITASGNSIRLPAENLKPFGFGTNDNILASGRTHMCGQLAAQEYFLLPEKYLFLELHGLDKCRSLGESASFSIEFELATNLPYKPAVGANSFALHAVPAINLFKHNARPALFDRSGTQKKISVAGSKPEHYQIYSVDQVSTFNKDADGNTIFSRAHKEIHDLTGNAHYYLSYIQSNTSHGYDTWIGIHEAPVESSGYKTKVDIELTCSNGALAEQLVPGDVCIPASTTPEQLQPSNISRVTSYSGPCLQQNRQWKLFSILMLNGAARETTAGVKAALEQLAISDNRNHAACKASLARVEAIESIDVKQSDRIIHGKIHRGYEILLKLNPANFSCPGDMYLFACAFERFLGGYVSEHFYIRMTFEDKNGAYRFDWPARFGDRSVL